MVSARAFTGIILATVLRLNGATFNVAVTTSPTQAVLTYTVPSGAACTISLTEAGSSAQVHDTDPSLFAGSNLDSRPGSITNGAARVLVLGKRAAEKAGDSKYYSRALQAFTAHAYTIQCGADSASGTFTTANPPIREAYPELPGWAPDTFGHYAWPTIDWQDQSKTYVDPLTGILLKRITSPGDFGTRVANQLFAFALDPSGAWSNAQNAASGNTNSLATVNTTSPLFLGVGSIQADYVDIAGFAASWVTDDVLEHAFGSGTDSNAANRSFSVCLSTDSGQSCASNSLSLTAPLTSPAAIPSPGSFPAAPFVRWGGKFIGSALIAPPSGKVNMSGNAVTLINPGASSYFNLAWVAGTKVYVSGTAPACGNNLCTIVSVDNISHLTVQESASVSNADYRGANFGLRISKTTATGSISLSFSYDLAVSHGAGLPASGSNDLCSRNSDTTNVAADGSPLSSPAAGYLCIGPKSGGVYALYFFIPATGEMRLLSNFYKPWDGAGVDGSSGTVSVTENSFDPVDPRAFYGLLSTGGVDYSVFRGRYSGDFRAWNPGYQYPPPPDNVTWTNLTLASQSRGIKSQLATNSNYDPAILQYIQGHGVLGTHYIVAASTAQDAPCLLGFFDITTGNLTSSKDSWSDYPGRWGTCHSNLALGAGDWMISGISPARYPNPSVPLQGPFYLAINQIMKNGSWSNDTSLDASYADACPTDISQQWQALGATGNNCILMRVGGEPCSITPTATEKTKYPCPYDPNRSMLQTIAEGDLIADFGGSYPFHERMRVVKKVVNSATDIVLTLQRKAFCVAATDTFNHANGWSASMAVPGGCYGAGWWINMTGNPSAWVLEDPTLTSSHFDIGTSVDGTSVTAVKGSYQARITQSPSQFGNVFPVNINGWPTFAGSAAVIRGNGTIETYPSMRQWNAPLGERRWTIDFRAYQAGTGVLAEYPLTLYQNNPQLVAGTTRLYKIDNPIGGFDRKRLPYLAWTGRNILKDMSGPNSLIQDSDQYRFCVADNPGECRPGSAVNDAFVNVPQASIDSPPSCTTSQYSSNHPCFTTASPIGAWLVQWDMSNSDTAGANFRRLTMGFSGPGRQYAYANGRPTPDGKWVFLNGYWLDGYHSELLAAKLPPWPATGPDQGADFVWLNVNRGQGRADAPLLRVKFGYAENGDPADFYCTPRQEACYTGGSPFHFASEVVSDVDCSAGCTAKIPAIPGRVLYYQVERRSSDGGVVRPEPTIQAVAVP